MVPIDKDVPLPADRRVKYPFASMQVGDSFFVAGAEFNTIAVSARRWANNNPGQKFTTRTVDGGVRVWRIK